MNEKTQVQPPSGKTDITITPVESTQLYGMGYHPESETLALQFPRGVGPGAVYHYAGVTAAQWKQLQEAESKGRWFGLNIKNNKLHPFVKLAEPEPVAS